MSRKENTWRALVALKQAIDNNEGPWDYLELELDKDSGDNSTIRVGFEQEQPNFHYFFRDDAYLQQLCELPEGWDESMLKTYLPTALISVLARRKKRPLVIAHFAQTLDGRIATNSGHSKWIGNEENLDHSHRMRALCDAILVGRGTVEQDKPKLNVRRVAGFDPVRVILDPGLKGEYDYMHEHRDGTFWVMCEGNAPKDNGISFLRMPDNNDERMPCRKVCKELFKRGVHSIYVEGGPSTTSRFLNDGCVDLLQLHIAPQVFGSGRSSLELQPIEKVDDAVSFRWHRFVPMGDAVMFEGAPV